jgi:hypothetical protein
MRPDGEQARYQRREEESTNVSPSIARAVCPRDRRANEQRDRKPELVSTPRTVYDWRPDSRAVGGGTIHDGAHDGSDSDEAQSVDEQQRSHAADGAPCVAAEVLRRAYVRDAAVGLGRCYSYQRR